MSVALFCATTYINFCRHTEGLLGALKIDSDCVSDGPFPGTFPTISGNKTFLAVAINPMFPGLVIAKCGRTAGSTVIGLGSALNKLRCSHGSSLVAIFTFLMLLGTYAFFFSKNEFRMECEGNQKY